MVPPCVWSDTVFALGKKLFHHWTHLLFDAPPIAILGAPFFKLCLTAPPIPVRWRGKRPSFWSHNCVLPRRSRPCKKFSPTARSRNDGRDGRPSWRIRTYGLYHTRPVPDPRHPMRTPDSRFRQWLGKACSPARPSASLRASRAVAVRKPLLQQRAAQPVEHARGSKHRQETVRKLTHQAG